MDNAPNIILFWYFSIVTVTFMIALMIVAIILIKKGKERSDKKKHFIGKIYLTLSVICSVPIILVVGYILYIYIGVNWR